METTPKAALLRGEQGQQRKDITTKALQYGFMRVHAVLMAICERGPLWQILKELVSCLKCCIQLLAPDLQQECLDLMEQRRKDWSDASFAGLLEIT